MQFITLFGSVRKLDKLARAEKHLMSFGTSPPLFFYNKKSLLENWDYCLIWNIVIIIICCNFIEVRLYCFLSAIF